MESENVPAVVDVTPEVPEGTREPSYAGAAGLQLSRDEADRLTAPIPPEDLDILPTGEVYASQVRYRRILNDVFGPGGWGLVPREGWTRQGNTLCRPFALIVHGHFVSEAIGEADYQPTNSRMSWASAAEAAKSNALTRCCKDLGIASECWDRRFCETFKAEHCVCVWVQGKQQPQWRRKDAKPFYKETGFADGVPTPGDTEPQQRQPSASTGSGRITAGQRGLIWAKAKHKGLSEDDVHNYLGRELGIESVNDIPANKVNDVLAWIDGGGDRADG